MRTAANHLLCFQATLAGVALCLVTACASTPHAPNQQQRYGGSPPDCWVEARIYQTDDDAYHWASRTKIEPVDASRPAQITLSPNKAYYFAFTDEAPHQSVLVFSEKERFTRISFADAQALADVRWINEKLLYMRVWWGRIAATDLVFDVEADGVVLSESTHYGQSDMEQYRDMCPRLGGCKCIGKTAQ